jgi:hypothetical protein
MADADHQLQKTVLVIGCFAEVPECRVYFEPTGVSQLLRSGESVTLEAVLPRGDKIDVTYGHGSITVWAEGTSGRVLMDDGSELAL